MRLRDCGNYFARMFAKLPTHLEDSRRSLKGVAVCEAAPLVGHEDGGRAATSAVQESKNFGVLSEIAGKTAGSHNGHDLPGNEPGHATSATQKSQKFGVLSKNVGKLTGSCTEPRRPGG